MFRRKAMLQDALDSALKFSEANVIVGAITEENTFVCQPHWECDLSTEDLDACAAEFACRVADQLSEGEVVAMWRGTPDAQPEPVKSPDVAPGARYIVETRFTGTREEEFASLDAAQACFDGGAEGLVDVRLICREGGADTTVERYDFDAEGAPK